jgi:hypothetical protein
MTAIAAKLGFDLSAGATTAHFSGLAAQPASAPSERVAIRLDTSTGTIYGTLDLPAGVSRCRSTTRAPSTRPRRARSL